MNVEDELYRLLLYYRDRRGGETQGTGETLSRMLVVGEMLNKESVSEIVNETLGADLRPLDAEDLGLSCPRATELRCDRRAGRPGDSVLAIRRSLESSRVWSLQSTSFSWISQSS